MPLVAGDTRLPTVQMLRGLAACLVLLRHTTEVVLLKWQAVYVWAWFLPGWTGVDFFFVLSGFIICYTHWRDFFRHGRLAAYLSKRLVRIYPIYWAVTLTVLPVYFAVRSFGTGFETNLDVIAKSLLLIPQDHVIVGQAWTLSYEMLFYLAVAFLIGIRPAVSLPIFAVWVAVLLLEETGVVHLRSGYLDSDHSVAGVFFNPFILEFLIGCFIGIIVRLAAGSQLAWPALIGGSVCFILSWVGVLNSVIPMYSSASVAAFGVSSALMVFGAAHLDLGHRLPVWRLPLLIGNASYSIYLVHFAALSAGAIVLTPVMRYTHMPAFILGSVLAIGGLVAGLGCYLFVERPLTTTLRRRLGLRASASFREQPVEAIVEPLSS